MPFGAYYLFSGDTNEEREEAGSLPFGYAQGRNDNQKGKGKGKGNGNGKDKSNGKGKSKSSSYNSWAESRQLS